MISRGMSQNADFYDPKCQIHLNKTLMCHTETLKWTLMYTVIRGRIKGRYFTMASCGRREGRFEGLKVSKMCAARVLEAIWSLFDNYVCLKNLPETQNPQTGVSRGMSQNADNA